MKRLLPFVEKDPWLWPMADRIEKRYDDYIQTKSWIERAWGSLYGFASAHHYFGLHLDAAGKKWTFREWLPHARHVFLTGDFNLWDQTSHPLHRVQKTDEPFGNIDGVWEIEIPVSSAPALTHLSRYKIYVQACDGRWAMRMPAYTFLTRHDETSQDFCAVV